MTEIPGTTDDRLRQIASIANAEPLGSLLYFTHAGLLLFGAFWAALLFDIYWLGTVIVVYVVILTLEKYTAMRARDRAAVGMYPVVLAFLHLRALSFNALVLAVWAADGGDVFKMAALALLVAATINIMVFHATFLTIVVLVVTPIWLSFAGIALIFYLQNGPSLPVVGAVLVFACITPYFYLSLRSARKRWGKQVQAERALSQSQKIDLMGQVAGGVSHDFNNILSVISGSLQMLETAQTDAERQRLVTTALRAANRGAELNKQMLALGKRSTLLPKPTNMRSALREFRDFARRVLPASIEIRIAQCDADLTVLVDPGMFQSALLNLALNARDAMPDGGTIRVAARRNSSDIVRVEISDTGQGIDPQIIEQVFEPFFTTREVGGGSGLGLPMVKGFAEQSNGHLSLTSTPGHGTRVVMFLPAAAAEQASLPAEIARVAPDHAPRAGRILIVEDNAQLLGILRMKLTRDGHEVVACEDGDCAVAAFDREPDFDLVLCDMVMPGTIQGLDFLRIVRERSDTIPFVLMSGYAPLDRAEQRELMGAVDLFLEKPLDLKHLDEAIRGLLDPEAAAPQDALRTTA